MVTDASRGKFGLGSQVQASNPDLLTPASQERKTGKQAEVAQPRRSQGVAALRPHNPFLSFPTCREIGLVTRPAIHPLVDRMQNSAFWSPSPAPRAQSSQHPSWINHEIPGRPRESV